MQGGIRAWWLLAACALEAVAAVLYFRSAGDQGFHLRNTVVLLGRLVLATGACAIAAAVRTAPRNWFLALNGMGFGFLGLVLNGVFGFRIGFRAIAFLILITALSMAAVEWRAGLRLRHEQHDWRAVIFIVSALLLLLFGAIFGVMTITGLKTAPGSNPELVLLGWYFALSAASTLVLVWGPKELALRP